MEEETVVIFNLIIPVLFHETPDSQLGKTNECSFKSFNQSIYHFQLCSYPPSNLTYIFSCVYGERQLQGLGFEPELDTDEVDLMSFTPYACRIPLVSSHLLENWLH